MVEGAFPAETSHTPHPIKLSYHLVKYSKNADTATDLMHYRMGIPNKHINIKILLHLKGLIKFQFAHLH